MIYSNCHSIKNEKGLPVSVFSGEIGLGGNWTGCTHPHIQVTPTFTKPMSI